MKEDKEIHTNDKEPCSHPHFEKEYILGFDTGDIICTRCGAVFSRDSQLSKFKK
ncbi:hypothetical protein [Draconibacterium orientale]|uniref:hypothetical protein n=1 Tax=Draconibacterium orientale TaxID=1168034 RepID=UPI0029BFC600|nr:hypothetical protein [Draconibacterium orientale]